MQPLEALQSIAEQLEVLDLAVARAQCGLAASLPEAETWHKYNVLDSSDSQGVGRCDGHMTRPRSRDKALLWEGSHVQDALQLCVFV
jgi:hypothetical protein